MRRVVGLSLSLVVLLGTSASVVGQDFGVMLHNQTVDMPNSGKLFGWNFSAAELEYEFDTTLTSNARLVGAGDFNADSWSDAVVTYTDSSQIDILYFQEGILIDTQTVDQPLSTGHQVVGVSDFDGDGTPDLLVQAPNARLTVWLMGGAAGEEVLEEIALGSPIIGGIDRFSGFADVNGDGLADVILHRTKKDLVYWESTGDGVVMSGAKPERIPLLTYNKKSRLHGYGRTHVIGSFFAASIAALVVRENKPGDRYSLWYFGRDILTQEFTIQLHFRNASHKKPVSAGGGY